MRRNQPKLEDYSTMFLPRTDEERFATMSGQTAMTACAYLPPGRKRLKAFHMLRVAARKCPGSLYNLGNFLSAHKPGRPRRYELSTDILISAANMARERIVDAGSGDNEWPSSEYFLRDIASRALTDLGARISNIGSPGEAVGYFREAIKLFPGNSNSWLCLGNMGIYFSHETGVDRLEGIDAWEKAYSIGDPDSDIDGIEADRRHAVGIMKLLVKMYGGETLDDWIDERLLILLEKGKKGLIELKPIVAEPEDLGVVTGKPWNEAATEAASMLGDMLYDMFPEELGIEQKITLAASFLLSILNLKATSEAQKRLAVKTALERCEGFEPLWPFLGDEEWESVGLPETEYLLFADSKALYSQAVAVLAGSLLEELPGISAADAAAALLFHLDSGFRQGVTSMIAPQIGKMNGKVEYLPAVYVGGARPPPGAHR